jgi:hypothetical protein
MKASESIVLFLTQSKSSDKLVSLDSSLVLSVGYEVVMVLVVSTIMYSTQEREEGLLLN